MRTAACLMILLVFLLGATAGLAHTAEVPVEFTVVREKPPADCGSGITGCAYSDRNNRGPAIFWGDDHQKTLEHEKGHLYDWFVLKNKQRSDFRDIFGKLEGRRWRNLPSEWFAEGYARCAIHMPTGKETAYGYDPTRRQHKEVCKLIWSTEKEYRASVPELFRI